MYMKVVACHISDIFGDTVRLLHSTEGENYCSERVCVCLLVYLKKLHVQTSQNF